MSWMSRCFCDNCNAERPRVDFIHQKKAQEDWTKQQKIQWDKYCRWVDVIVKDRLGKFVQKAEFAEEAFAGEVHLCPKCIGVFHRLTAKNKIR